MCRAVNYVSVAEYGGAAPELVAAGIAADNAVVAPYFVGLFAASGPATATGEAACCSSSATAASATTTAAAAA